MATAWRPIHRSIIFILFAGFKFKLMEDSRGLALLIGTLFFLIPTFIGLYKMFEKAGEAGWKGLVPVYNLVVILRLAGRPWSWIFYLFIPVIGQVIMIGLIVDFVKCYGKNTVPEYLAAVVFPFIYFPYLGFKNDVVYRAPVKEEGKKSGRQEWTEAIGFAVIAATLIRWLIMEAYTIPTPSMENSLLVGDFLFVSKFHYGTRTTTTPLQVPLTHQKIWFTNIPSYVEWIKLPQYRLPGLTHVKRGDVVVFNVPPRGLNEDVDYPVDLKTNYIKRCVAVPGDTLFIQDKQVYTNGEPLPNPPEMQYSYVVTSDSPINDRNLRMLGLGPEDTQGGGQQNGKFYYLMFLTKERAEALKKLSYIKSVVIENRNEVEGQIPYSRYYDVPSTNEKRYSHWGTDNFGPLWIPKKGVTIPINDSTLTFYGPTIKMYDHNKDVKIENGRLYIEGKEVTEYTFKQDYYFMMGDNRHNSLDSRFWGFVPEDHIVGKAFFIWLSIDRNADFFHKIRWNRFFNLIR
jgi:signal peptidase I